MTYPLFSHTCASDTQSSGKAASPLPAELPMAVLTLHPQPFLAVTALAHTGALGWSDLPAFLIHSSFPGRADVALQFTSYPSETLSSRLWTELARIKSNRFLKFISNFQCLLCHRINISPAGGLACLFFFPLQISFFLFSF